MDNNLPNNSSQWLSILDKLFVVSYEKTDEINKIEQEIYFLLQKNLGQLEGLITLMFVQIMNGNRPKAKALAHKIWDVGGAIEPIFERLYIENLLNLGLHEMALVLLKPRFEEMRENIGFFYFVMLKYALQTGNINLLQRLGTFPNRPDDEDDDSNELFAFVDVYETLGNRKQFYDMQKIVLENSLENLCSYEYDVYNDRGFPEVEIFIYTNLQEVNCQKLQKQIEDKIAAYWVSSQMEQLHNFIVTVHNIQYHDAREEAESTSNGFPADYKLNW